MKKMTPVILLLAAMALFLFGKWYFDEPEAECITRAQTARMLAWALYDMEAEDDSESSGADGADSGGSDGIDSNDADDLDGSGPDAGLRKSEGIRLLDVDDSIWYADEIQMVLRHGLMGTDGDLFHPTEFLTYSEAKNIAASLGMDFEIPPLKEKTAMPLKIWLTFYDGLIKDLDTVTVENLTVEAVPAVSSELKPWQARTSLGLLSYEGVSLDSYVGQEVRAYVSKDQLLMATLKEEMTAEIIEAEGVNPSAGAPQTTMAETNTSETDMEGTDITETKPQDGETTVEALEAAASAAETDRQEKEYEIRVCLLTSDFSSQYHEKLTVMADTNWVVTFSDGIRECLPGETVTLTAEDFEADGDMAEIRSLEDGKLEILSLERNSGFPSYEGTLRVIRSGDSLVLVNILPLEHYLYGVVPGEMPASYGEEALKAQAVCARSYAMLALESPKYDWADVDDSTSCQVYMNQGTDERSSEAVDATMGQVLLYENEIVTAKYFSTSCGSTSSSSDIWLYADEAESIAHMAGRMAALMPDEAEIILSDEKIFQQFIDSPKAGVFVEEKEPWFRWQMAITLDDIGVNISHSLKQRMAVNPKHFTLLSENGEMDPDDIKEVEILERADSGVVKRIRISGDNQTLTASGEYNIRCLLAPSPEQSITLNDGSAYKGLSLLPSGYFYLSAREDGTGYTIRGGGLGHGAGLSQNGARLLAEAGYDYKEILEYFFTDITIGLPVNGGIGSPAN